MLRRGGDKERRAIVVVNQLLFEVPSSGSLLRSTSENGIGTQVKLGRDKFAIHTTNSLIRSDK